MCNIHYIIKSFLYLQLINSSKHVKIFLKFEQNKGEGENMNLFVVYFIISIYILIKDIFIQRKVFFYKQNR